MQAATHMPLLSTATATATLAAGLIATSASQWASTAWQQRRGRVRRQRACDQVQLQLQRETEYARLRSSLNDRAAGVSNSGWRVVEVIETVDESADCRSFYLADPTGHPLPSFRPGQFVAVRPALGGARQPTRCYSLSDSPSQPWWRITVKDQRSMTLVDHPRSHPGTLLSPNKSGSATGLSQWLHAHISVGDSLLIHGPSGTFFDSLEHHVTRPIVFLAAGIGITPIVSMVKHLLETQPSRRLHIHFQVQDAQHWPMGAMLHSWQTHRPALQMASYFSRGGVIPAISAGLAVPGKVDLKSIGNIATNAVDAEYAICGPNAWTDAMCSGLMEVGIPGERIHFESFGPSHGTTTTGATDPETKPWTLRFAESEVQVPLCSDATTLWQAARAHGIEIPTACHTGACGTCRVKLLAGAVNYDRPPTAACASGEALACVAQPVGDVVVQA